jgi:hypothetical protein
VQCILSVKSKGKIEMKNKSNRALTPKKLRKHPYVQAAAVTLVARMLMHDIDGNGQDEDDIPQVAWDVVFKKAAGLPEGDRREAVVADLIGEVADEMQAVLVKKGLLDKDCARKYQQQRAA